MLVLARQFAATEYPAENSELDNGIVGPLPIRSGIAMYQTVGRTDQVMQNIPKSPDRLNHVG
jgi:hypothetical protein